MEYKITQRIVPTMNWNSEVLTLSTEIDGMIQKMVTEQINFKEECVRKALIGLGWTPPKENIKWK